MAYRVDTGGQRWSNVGILGARDFRVSLCKEDSNPGIKLFCGYGCGYRVFSNFLYIIDFK